MTEPLSDAMLEWIAEHEYEKYEAQMNDERFYVLREDIDDI